MKKYPMMTRISAARPVSPQRMIRSGRRAAGGRSSIERPPGALRLPASNALLERASVALQGAHLGLSVRVEGVGQCRVLQLRRDLLTVAEGVVEPALDRGGL